MEGTKFMKMALLTTKGKAWSRQLKGGEKNGVFLWWVLRGQRNTERSAPRMKYICSEKVYALHVPGRLPSVIDRNQLWYPHIPDNRIHPTGIQ